MINNVFKVEIESETLYLKEVRKKNCLNCSLYKERKNGKNLCFTANRLKYKDLPICRPMTSFVRIDKEEYDLFHFKEEQ